MAELKTFLFTDVVGSVELKRAMPGHSDAERDQAFIEQVLTPHRGRIEEALDALGGRVVSTAGDGHFLVFSDTVLAARWAVGIQQSHRDRPIDTPGGRQVGVRVSMHLGIPQIDPRDKDNFVGKTVDYAARLNDLATGGQVLVSRSVVAILEDAGMDGVVFHHQGTRDLKGIGEVDIYELVYDQRGPRQMRPQPAPSPQRQWTVLPATMGLTEFQAQGGRPATLPATSAPPQRLGNYELQGRLGGGGMGDVYKARHRQFGRDRAVKVIKHHFVESGHREVVQRFYQEIKAVGALEHPNIVVAIDSSMPSDPVHYLVMEFIDGASADELVERHGPLEVADACEVILQAARGLAYIHQHGMVHRDLKPSNLMLTIVPSDAAGSDAQSLAEPAGKRALVKILDLGLALLVGEDQQRLTLFDDRPMGTAMYMSPEQWKTTSVDIRADIYSLGCTLYHLLSGKPPYWDSDLRPEKAHEREALREIQGPRPIPPEVWQIVARMTAKQPADRYAEPAEVVAALAPWTEGHRLVPLIERATRRGAGELTRGEAHSDTQVARTGRSDTLQGRTRPAAEPPPARPPRRKLWRVTSTVLLALALGAIGFLAIVGPPRSQGLNDDAQARRLHTLKLAASYAASEIHKEIETRFDILRELADDPQVRQWMTEINAAPEDESRWQELGTWINAQKPNVDQRAASESLFINNRLGLQVARSPFSDDSYGRSYAHRDYFHGQGADLEPGASGVEPIAEPHISSVYRSTSTGHLKVAFSVPIDNGRRGPAREVLGTAAMSVDLGEFNVLEHVLDRDRGQEVVLIDLRPDYVDQPAEGESPDRGLILHHRRVESYDQGETPPRLRSELLAGIEQELATASSTRPERRKLLLDYADPLSSQEGRPFWGAVEPVLLDAPGDARQETGWIVLVQEPAVQ